MGKFFCWDMMKSLINTTLIVAPHLGEKAVLEADVLWQGGDLALLCHPNPKLGGNMNHKVITALYCYYRKCGMSVLRFNYRGVGASSGQIDYGWGEFDDALCVLRWVINEAKNKQIGIKSLNLCGFSFGGVVACRLANYLLDKPFVELSHLILLAPSVIKHDLTNVCLPKNTLMIYGDKDEWVSPDALGRFANQFNINAQVINGAGHFFNGRLDELIERIDGHY